MKKTLITAALFGVAICVIHPALAAQKIGDVCTAAANTTPTVRSIIPSEGAIECIPDSNGNYYWQPMGAGIARYDSTGACSIAGSVRWNGSAIQFCNGSGWQAIGGGGLTIIEGGCQTYWSGCPAGYQSRPTLVLALIIVATNAVIPRGVTRCARNERSASFKGRGCSLRHGLFVGRFPARSQEAAHPLTLADCPAGYVLGIQDTAEPQSITTAPANTSANPTGQNGAENSGNTGLSADAAPRRFITGCIPPQATLQK